MAWYNPKVAFITRRLMRRCGEGDMYSFKKVLSVLSVANQSQVTTHQNITNGAQAHFHGVSI